MSSEQVRRFEFEAALAVGCTLYELMQRAGKAAFEVLCSHWPEVTRILVVAGNGNNAGDGYILATLAKRKGIKVVVACENPSRLLSGSARQAQQEWLQAGGMTVSFSETVFDGIELVVDALLGSGVSGPVKESFEKLILKLNNAQSQVLSLDLPSGMNADTGAPLPICVAADVTITFVAIKPGLVTGKAKSLCGVLEYDDLGIGESFFRLVKPLGNIVNWKMLQTLAPRAVHANKGHFGKLLCVGGNLGMSGAIRLSSEAALRSGTGLVKVFCHESSALAVSTTRPELMVSTSHLTEALDWCASIIIGPGLGTDEWAKHQFKTVIAHVKEHNKPIVIDADGLNLLALNADNIQDDIVGLSHCVLTPHPGEASRLLNESVQEVEADRYTSCKALANTFQATCLLKGAGTVICSASHKVIGLASHWVCDGGNPGMATAGMGDVLTGIIGSFLAQGMQVEQGAVYGTCAHAQAGDKVAREYGERGMMASDLLPALRATINNL